MECSGKREIRGEVKTQWMDSVEEWKPVDEKDVAVVKREERLSKLKLYLSNPSSFGLNGQMINCSESNQSWFINQELKSVWFFVSHPNCHFTVSAI